LRNYPNIFEEVKENEKVESEEKPAKKSTKK